MTIATEEQRAIIKLYREGFDIRSLARYFGRSERYIVAVLNRYGYRS